MYDVLIIDGNNFARRALHAHERLSVKKESGRIPTGMIYGFFELTLSILNTLEGNPKIYVVWDKGRKKRTKIYPGYKGRRDIKDKDPKKERKKEELNRMFKKQMNMLAPILRASGIYQAFVPEEEADDVIGTLAKQLQASGQTVLIATGDHDMFQLIDKKIDLFLARTNGNKIWDISNFEKRNGILPEKMIDVMSLMGDTGDDIPGIKGIGEAKAMRVVKNNPEFVTKVLNDAKIDSEADLKQVTIKERELILKSFDVVKLAHSLVKIDCEMSNVRFIKPCKDMDKLETIFEFLEFNSYLNKNNWSIFKGLGGC